MSRKKYDRAKAVAAAMDVFWSRGYHGTSVGELCEATGLNRKSLYAEFGAKASLFEASLARYAAGGVAASRATLAREPLGLANVRAYFRQMHYGPNCRGCLMTVTVNERAHVPAGSVEQVGDAIHEIERLLRDNLVAAGQSAEGAERLAAFLVFSIQGITTMGKLEGDDSRLAQVVETILSVLD